ncbi:hypothetical protein BCR33DRAFT_720563 [Rhizoclosmatium globosum]|uniref:Uncharacterized protein n=1 Tax=Rhizoclosmatium globosum TaxID=329046 RepID=A0A1Y2BVY4_9FUNG|nr:hypothetical protein BCR33DRAFT_720563 [Rhizoclosmatium globosum]|eukprot:ORY38921.1 hypothetical protein BCR33DRAFT_720563 [Rhizoclosmatium globosum]
MSFSFAPTPIAPLQGLQKPVLSGFGASRDRKRKGFDEDDCMDESETSWDIQSKRINSNSMDSPSLATAQVPPLFSSTGTSTPYLPPTPSASDVWLSHSDLLAQQTQLDVNMTMMMTDDDQEIDSDATLSDVSSYYNHLSRHQNQQRQAAQLSRGDCALCKSGAGGGHLQHIWMARQQQQQQLQQQLQQSQNQQYYNQQQQQDSVMQF